MRGLHAGGRRHEQQNSEAGHTLRLPLPAARCVAGLAPPPRDAAGCTHGEARRRCLACSAFCLLSLADSPSAVLAQLKHPALTAFIGVGSHPLAAGSLLFLVTEAARDSPPQPHLATRPRLTRALQELGGDLRTLVIESLAQPNLYSNADVYRWLHDVASGLSYLHTRTPLVIHRDMKLEARAQQTFFLFFESSSVVYAHSCAQNVLITASGSAKITVRTSCVNATHASLSHDRSPGLWAGQGD